MKKALITFFLSVVSLSTAFSFQLSNQAKISVLTCSAGKELYSTFGHTAIRVQDPENGIDRVYNYGTFSFSEPGFYQKFIAGKLKYFVSVSSIDEFLFEYRYYNRSVYEQVLNLSAEETNEVFVFLQNNTLPENKYYLYDFLKDNCTTRVRDVVLQLHQGQQTFTSEEETTYRKELNKCLKTSPWSEFGIALVLGIPADKTLNIEEKMFLPDNFSKILATGIIDETGVKVAQSSQTLFEAEPEEATVNIFTPVVLFLTLLVIVFACSIIVGIRKSCVLMWFDRILYLSVGLIGCLLVYLWFFSNHQAPNWNMNLLWANPAWLFWAIYLRKNMSELLCKVARIWSYVLLLLCPLLLILPQNIHPALYCIIFILFFRLRIATIKEVSID